jgi:hypothetical protein
VSRLLWKETGRWEHAFAYPPALDPARFHPKQWGKLERHSYGAVYDPIDPQRPLCMCAVHSTERSADGWSYNLAELANRPCWAAWFHHAPTGQRVLHKSTDDAATLERAFDLHHVM